MTKHHVVENEIRTALEGNFIPTIEFKRREWKFSKNQREIINKILDQTARIVIIYGPAGTAKTYLAVYGALSIMARDKTKDILYIRTAVESASKQLGSLPGNLSRKFDPFIAPLNDKLEEMLNPHSIASVMKSEMLEALPVNFLRGASWQNKIVIVDEAQNFNSHEMATTLTRMGKNTQLILCGDPKQSDLNGRSCFPQIIAAFDDEESREHGIFTFRLTEEDIFRDEIVKFLVKKLSL
jgi:phosphate starvation-inducible PhoH-like protein